MPIWHFQEHGKKAFQSGFSENSKWTWRTVSEEITTKELPVCGGDLNWVTCGPSAIPEWALRQVSRYSLVKQAESPPLWCLLQSWARGGGAAVCISLSFVHPHEYVTVTPKITWPDSRVRGQMSEDSKICVVYSHCTIFLWVLDSLCEPEFMLPAVRKLSHAGWYYLLTLINVSKHHTTDVLLFTAFLNYKTFAAFFRSFKV